MNVTWNRVDGDERPIPLRSYWLALPNRLDIVSDREASWQDILDMGFRFLADQAATVVDSQGRACRMQRSEHEARRVDGKVYFPAGPVDWPGERLDVMVLVPIEEATDA